MVTIIRRLLLVIPAILVVTSALFMGVIGFLGSPAALMLGPDASYEAVQQLNRDYGFDRPLLIQYRDWLWNALQGNFGRAFITGQGVVDAITDALPITIELALLATLLASVSAVVINSIPVFRRAIIAVTTFFNIIGITTPNFMIGMMLIYVFAVALGWLPTTGWVFWRDDPVGHIHHLILPVLTMSAYYFGLFSIVYRSEYNHIGQRLFIQVARAKGISEWNIAFKHILPNAVLPVITFIGISMGQMMGGAIVVETVFSIPGLGRLFVNSILQHDFPVMMAIGCLMVVGVIIMNLLADVAYTLVNPQIRLD